MPDDRRRVPFPYDMELKKFDQAFRDNLRAYLNNKRAEFIPAENVQAYQHGTGWKSGVSDDVSELRSHEHELTVKFDDLIAHDVSSMRKTFLQLADALHGSEMRMMYSIVSKAADAAGNKVSAKSAGSHAEAFLEALRRIEFGVDRDGRPSLPQIHASPEMVDAMLKELQNQGPEFEREVERIKQEKIAEAQAREHSRLLRFKRIMPI